MNREIWISRIINCLSDDLLKPEYRLPNKHKTFGHCYVASEAFQQILQKAENYMTYPTFIRVNGVPHWFLKSEDGTIIDPTKDQFDCDIDYDKAIRKGFLTKEPSKRARILIERVKDVHQI